MSHRQSASLCNTSNQQRYSTKVFRAQDATIQKEWGSVRIDDERYVVPGTFADESIRNTVIVPDVCNKYSIGLR